MSCDIIIPIWNNLAFTRDCVEAITRNTRYPHRLILVDNASADETRVYLEKLAKERPRDVTLIRNDHNAGFVRAVNQGLEKSAAPYLCIMNNDTIPAPGWLGRMVAFAEAHPDVGLINPQCDGHGTSSIEEHAARLAREKGAYMEMNQCHGFCMLLRRELLDRIGYLDVVYGIGGYDDTDYSMRAHKAGFRSVAIRDAYVYHRLHGSFDKAGNRESWVRRNREIYYRKWGRHLRVGIIVPMGEIDAARMRTVIALAYGLAREWTWVHLWFATKAPKGEIVAACGRAAHEGGYPPHQNIRIDRLDLPLWCIDLTIAGKMLERLRKRMRDKRFDAVIALDGAPAAAVGVAAAITAAPLIRLRTDADVRWEEEGGRIAREIQETGRVHA